MTVACQSCECCFINAQEIHPFPFAMEMQLACVYMIAIISNSESPRSEKSNIQRKKY